jgi:hypothetical protein
VKPAIRWFFILSLLSGAMVELLEVTSTGVNAALVVLPLLICFQRYGIARLRLGIDVLLMAALAVVAGGIYTLYGLPTPAGQMRLVAYVFFFAFYCFSQLSLLDNNSLESICRVSLGALCFYMLLVDVTHLSELATASVSLGERFLGLGNPNYHGILSAIGLMLATYLGRERIGIPNLFRIFVLALLWLNLWAPKSRGSWMALAIFGFVFMLLQPFRYKQILAVLILALAPLAYALRPSIDSVGQAAGGLRLDSDSVGARSDVTFEALDMAIRVGYRPFGLGSTPILKALTSMNAIDNAYLCMMLETGFWGLGVFLTFIVRTIVRGLRICMTTAPAPVLRDYRWAFAAFVALAAHSMFESIIMSGLQLGSLLFLFCGALLNRPLPQESQSPVAELASAPRPPLLPAPHIVTV